MPHRRVIFVYMPGCEVLDFAGPLQALHEAIALGGGYRLEHCGTSANVLSAQGVVLAGLAPLPKVSAGDRVIVPGYPVRETTVPRSLLTWLKQSYESGASLYSVCTGAFALAQAGLLNGRRCTTHWKRTAELQKQYSAAKVLADRLFVEDGRIVTSAGIASGIDMALAMIERDHGPRLAVRVAREMVVYLRRDGAHPQGSVYLDFRTHLQPGIHAVQDWLSAQPTAKTQLPDLARRAHMSTRNLTRTFREATGITILEYRTRLRLEHARTLMRNPELSIENIAEACGFADARQFRRVWRQAYRAAPSRSRQMVPSPGRW